MKLTSLSTNLKLPKWTKIVSDRCKRLKWDRFINFKKKLKSKIKFFKKWPMKIKWTIIKNNTCWIRDFTTNECWKNKLFINMLLKKKLDNNILKRGTKSMTLFKISSEKINKLWKINWEKRIYANKPWFNQSSKKKKRYNKKKQEKKKKTKDIWLLSEKNKLLLIK